jgi:hypothetical protein
MALERHRDLLGGPAWRVDPVSDNDTYLYPYGTYLDTVEDARAGGWTVGEGSLQLPSSRPPPAAGGAAWSFESIDKNGNPSRTVPHCEPQPHCSPLLTPTPTFGAMLGLTDRLSHGEVMLSCQGPSGTALWLHKEVAWPMTWPMTWPLDRSGQLSTVLLTVIATRKGWIGSRRR